MAGSSKASAGCFPWVLGFGLFLVALKLTGIIGWPWLIVLAPLGFLLAVGTFLLIVSATVALILFILIASDRDER